MTIEIWTGTRWCAGRLLEELGKRARVEFNNSGRTLWVAHLHWRIK